MSKLKIAIIGCKNMGKKHLRILREGFADKVDVVGIMNSSPESSAKCAAELNVPYFASIDEINNNSVDAVIISSTATTHAEIGEKMLLQGIPCLIEKPLATTLSECEKLISAAETGKSLIVTGHTENYNSAVIRLKEELQYSQIASIKGIRTSRNSTNRTGISAVQELMIHDLAIVNSLIDDDLEASTIDKRSDMSWENHAVVKMKYKNGASVELEALREDREIERFMDIKDIVGNTFHIDFMDRRLIKNGRVLVEGGNSLQNELVDFIECVKYKRTPLVDMYQAKDIVKLCVCLEKGMSAKTPLLNNNF